MTQEITVSKYYIIESSNANRMLLGSLRDPSRAESWTLGRRFKISPVVPVVATIKAGFEKNELLPYFGTPPVMSNEFHAAMLEAGVDNLDVYEAVIRSKDGAVEYKGYKAFCVVGLIAAADLERTKFAADNPSRQIDASIEQLALDESKLGGVLCFRLAEYTGSVFVHEKVKRHLEKKNFPSVVFREVKDFVSL